MSRITMDAIETAEYLGISYTTVIRMVRRGEIPCIKAGRKLLFRQETLERWMDQQEKVINL